MNNGNSQNQDQSAMEDSGAVGQGAGVGSLGQGRPLVQNKMGIPPIGVSSGSRGPTLASVTWRALSQVMYHFWWRSVCPRPDWGAGKWHQAVSLRIVNFLYNWTGRRARFWHKQICDYCRSK